MLFFQRQKSLRDEWPKLFQTDSFPETLKAQLWIIFEDFVERRSYLGLEKHCERISKKLCREIGLYELNHAGSWAEEIKHFLNYGLNNATHEENVEYQYTALELIVQELSGLSGHYNLVQELNQKMRLAGVGFKIIDNTLIPFEHEELTEITVKPAMGALGHEDFEEAGNYMHKCFQDFKGGTSADLENAITNCTKACESVLKVILEKKGIEYNTNDTYMPLIQKAKEAGVLLEVSDDKFSPLLKSLTNDLKALGELRNKHGAHGQKQSSANDRIARLAISHASANILFLAECYLESN